MKKIPPAVLIIFGVAVITGIIFLAYSIQIQVASTPLELYNYTIYSGTGVGTDTLNASQGQAEQLNLTLTAFYSSPSIAIPIENIKLTWYTTDKYVDWNASTANDTVLQRAILNYTFDPKTLILQPNTANSTMITINWANNASPGLYTGEINLGSFKFLSSHGKYDQSYGSGVWVGFEVSPKKSS